ncbi:unnamed protein product [Microthlaspi erraticum]|uniref:NTF2 domain-containing protein n=1 Tax=Microthlaspi erraticum TaxID=1685480 RepID=A0A6D2KD15_9BRAS|nr:unnamed protein product [Microthlaspi erraticum]
MDPTPPAPPSAKVVGDVFAKHYYHVSQNLPDELHRFYTDASKIGRTDDGVMRVSTLPDIGENLNVLSCGGFDSAVVTSVISQDSNGGSVVVHVSGYFTSKETVERRSFTQAFFLAPQEEPRGYIVSNDILRVDDKPLLPANNVIEDQNGSIQDDQVQHPPTRPSPKAVGDEFAKRYFHILQNVPELLDKIYQDNSQITRPVEGELMRTYTLSDIGEKLNMLLWGGFDSAEVTSVTSVDSQSEGVLVFVSGSYFTSTTRRERKFIQTFFLARQEAPNSYFVFTDIFNFVDIPEATDGRLVSREDSGLILEGPTVHVKSLPPAGRNNMAIRAAFKRFGQVKPDGIRIKNTGLGSYYHAFVEFTEANAAKRAIEASPVWIAGIKVVVKRLRGPDFFERQRIREEEEVNMLLQGDLSKQLGGTGDFDFWDWLKSMEMQSMLKGDRHYGDYSQSKVMEEHSKFLDEIQRKLEEGEEGKEENQN